MQHKPFNPLWDKISARDVMKIKGRNNHFAVESVVPSFDRTFSKKLRQTSSFSFWIRGRALIHSSARFSRISVLPPLKSQGRSIRKHLHPAAPTQLSYSCITLCPRPPIYRFTPNCHTQSMTGMYEVISIRHSEQRGWGFH